MSLSRRGFLAGAGSGTAALFGNACSRAQPPNDGKLHLRLSTWGEPVELEAFRRVIRRYEALHSDIRIDLQIMSYNVRNQVDMLIAAGLGPDLVRVQYLEVGRYSPSGALIDLTKYLPPHLGSEFTEQTWAAVQYRGCAHAIPHHTDTSAILYNRGAFQKIGIKPPQTLSESWPWDEFTEVARALQRHGFDYGFAMNWTMGGAFRWLNFLYQHGGTLLTGDHRRSAIPSELASETLEWTRSFFTRRLVPASDSAQSAEQVENLFATGVVGMYFDIGPQALQVLSYNFEYGVTFLPRDKAFAAELGGNAIGISRDCKHPDIAADFALFLTNEENMRDFVTAALFLPVRRNLVKNPPVYPKRPDEMRVHLEQATTVPLELARTVTLPEFHRIGKALGDELDLTFTGGQSLNTTQNRLAAAIARAL